VKKTLDSLALLASLYHDQDRYADAEPLYRRTLAIREKGLGPEHPRVAVSLNDLGLLLADNNRQPGFRPNAPLFQTFKKKKADGPGNVSLRGLPDDQAQSD
jgi:hypothetical protein